MGTKVVRWAIAAILLATTAANAVDDTPEDTMRSAWTLDEAQAHLRLYPRDAYVQYVALQLARREGKVDEVAQEIAQLALPRNQGWERREQVDLFSIFSGQLAVQESLQLDAMRGEPVRPEAGQQGPQRRVGPGGNREANNANATSASPVDVASLVGPTIKSHPWEEMLAGRKPEISRLARCVPEDNYFVEFRSVNKLLEATELSSLWGAHALNQSVQQAQTQLVDKRLREQLAVEVSDVLRPFYDKVVDGVAVTGSDLFLREGSDVTLLFRVSQPAVFRGQMDLFLANTQKLRPDARRSSGNYLGVPFDLISTPDRQVHVFSAYPEPGLHVRSNSRIGMERVIAAIKGKTSSGRVVRSLGDSTEFAFIRTLMPPGAKEEDGLIYLSDPFIRRLVGPTLRLTEQRRMHCYNHLKMIGHAALMYRTERGRNASSLAELASAQCCPGEFGQGEFACPDGGEYTLAEDGLTGLCAHHGYASYLTPCCESETTRVTEDEAEAYRRFLEAYNSYWRTFFDPIAIRLQISPERYRAETIVLPLIDNSIYSGLSQSLGGEPEALDALPVPKRNIFSFAVRLNKNSILRQMGLGELMTDEDAEREGRGLDVKSAEETARAVESLKNLSLGMLNFAEANGGRYPAAATTGKNGESLLSWRVQILPYIEQRALYDEFHHDEPWDSEHNLKLVARIPEMYRPDDAKLAAAGKTRFVTPRGANTIMSLDRAPHAIKEVTDGTSQTALIVEADSEHAIVWTKPDDLEIDVEKPHAGLATRPPGILLAAFADASVHRLNQTISRDALAGAMTRSGEEIADLQQYDMAIGEPTRRDYVDPQLRAMAESLGAGELLAKGVGNQVAFHVYDAEPMFDLSMSRVLGQSLGSFNGRGMGFNDDILGIAMIIGALNSPVYVSIPIKDAAIVDRFLGRLDGYLGQLARQETRGGFFDIDQDFYRLEGSPDGAIRSYGARLGPVKWRFFWSRIGEAVYIASKAEILEDLRKLHAEGPVEARDAEQLKAHAMVRVRPQHWQRVLSHFQLGWEENNREACLQNLGPLSSLSRALSASSSEPPRAVSLSELEKYAAQLHDVRYFCPDAGRYEVAADGITCSCATHGSALLPRQTAAPAKSSELGKLIDEFADMSVALSFLEDGLHAVVTLERTPAAK